MLETMPLSQQLPQCHDANARNNASAGNAALLMTGNNTIMQVWAQTMIFIPIVILDISSQVLWTYYWSFYHKMFTLTLLYNETLQFHLYKMETWFA